MDAIWRVEMLGGLRAVRAGEEVTHFGTRTTAALLGYLAYHPAQSHSREGLAELLWPDEDPAATRVRLRTALVTLRQILEADLKPGSVLQADRNNVQLFSASVTTD